MTQQERLIALLEQERTRMETQHKEEQASILEKIIHHVQGKNGRLYTFLFAHTARFINRVTGNRYVRKEA